MDTMTAARSNVIVIVEVLTQESVLIDLLFCTFSPVVHDYHSRILDFYGIINAKHLPDEGFTVSFKKNFISSSQI